MSASTPKWQLSGDYFENCSCDVVCPCLVSTNAPMTSRPTQGHCAVVFAIHIDRGTYGDVSLDGLNAAMVAYTPGPMGEGHWRVGAYIDERADDRQQEALGAIFGGAAGGPMAAFAPLIEENLGAKRAAIAYRIEGKRRSAEIPGILSAAVRPLPTLRADEEMWVAAGHPFNPDKLALAVGEAGSKFQDFGMRFDNSGRNGHYAAINWSNA
ncbi:MAG: DUF1326 domain-containing protein [Alphaproteobacteria bacterium]|nr:DUF1326 domain-containing protein [Alphaproteobacteria bacterium]